MQTEVLEEEAGGNYDRSFGIARLALTDFRNYATLDVTLNRGFNVVHGPNAQGKTNLLEAVHLISTTRLLRSSRDAEAIRSGADVARIQATLATHETELATILERGVRKRVLLNGLALKRASDAIGRAPTVSISTLDMEIARGEPADRRMFLDLELSQTYPAYLVALTHYKRALEQRNALLKTAQVQFVDAALFESWETHLAEAGATLRSMRRRFVSDLKRHLDEIHGWMAPGEAMEAHYAQKDANDDESALRAGLEASRGQDVARGTTSLGPHRDDLSLLVGGMDARSFGSQGQQRTTVISLKLATMELARRTLGAAPILLLDDILSDLDERRRRRLVEWVVQHAGQGILTCTEASSAGPDILSQAAIFRVEQGVVSVE